VGGGRWEVGGGRWAVGGGRWAVGGGGGRGDERLQWTLAVGGGFDRTLRAGQRAAHIDLTRSTISAPNSR
jgi:hypothetical protein